MLNQTTALALDAGQSSTRARLVGADADDLSLTGVNTAQPLAPQWDALIRTALAADRDAPGPVTTVAVGSSGLGRETAHDLLALLGGTPVRRVVLAHDSITSYLGALGDGEGCVIAAGTGTICLAVGPHEAARVDGWGNLIGDAGSAYWIGRTAMEAAMRGYDGRRQMTALTGLLKQEFPDLENAYLELQSDPDKVARIAAFSAQVNQVAASDRVAGTIMDKAAAHLSESVQAALRRVRLGGPNVPRVAAIGGVFGSERVLRRFTDYLTLQWPTFALITPQGEGIDGAQALLTLPVMHPLYARLSIAER
ncbi:MAG TPA: BadF/BadG/BcrA/BcrD ATPase family protein [Propioniciclava sp.]|uniref:N-acetylglucosamine kinase n=1 Tax=Propioniciclava sp. TaxID=2038686 RepID=UPI002CF243B2|nr:BadF/BadG/BcrA/BcrD ATPase family protein [Propioniciclava sp.]HRL48047.1 BadF/BadG/BcrA/BcrD ATPase family protein [Propioniciclava sp.]